MRYDPQSNRCSRVKYHTLNIYFICSAITAQPYNKNGTENIIHVTTTKLGQTIMVEFVVAFIKYPEHQSVQTRKFTNSPVS